MRRAVALALGCLLLCPAVRAEWSFDAEVGLRYDDNLSNSLESADRKGDGAGVASAAAGYYQQLGANTRLGLAVVVDGESYLRYSGLTNVGLGLQANLRHKFGLGSQAPWVALAVQAVHRDYRYDDRTGWEYDAAASFGKQLTERWSLRASVRYDRYAADHLQPAVLPGISTAAYDTSGWTFGLHALFYATEADTLSASYTHRNGTVTAVTPPEWEILEYSDAVALDTVFADDPPLIAYRIKARTDTLALVWSRALGRHAALNFAYSYQRSTTETEPDNYYSNVLAITLNYSW
jgi:hypothetical protein